MAEYNDRTTQSSGSESRFDLVCIPCNTAGKRLEAEGYCTDCCEHLCAPCIRYHRILSALKHHELVGKASMPLDQKDPLAKDVCTERCKTHSGKVLEYFCPNHKVLGCSVCVTLKHNHCGHVAYIPELSTDLEQSNEYKIYRQQLDELMRQSQVIINSSKEKLDQSNYFYVKVQQDILLFRQEINTALDRLEEDLKAKSEEIHSQNIDSMDSVSSKTNQVLDELQAISSGDQELLSKKQYCQAFTNMKTTDLVPLHDKLNDLKEVRISNFILSPGEEFMKMINGKSAIGNILERNPGRLITYCMDDINVKTIGNTGECIIRGSVLLSKYKLVVTDRGSGTVKLVDVVNNKVSCELKPEKYPWTVANIDKGKVAVTIPTAEKILILRCDDMLVIDTKISVDGQCYGIAYCHDKLIVTFYNPSRLDIISMTGNLLQRFENDTQGNIPIINPRYVSINTDDSSVFVSCWGNHTLTKLSLDGKVMAVYRDTEKRRPGQCVIDETGLVYLCGENAHNIYLLTNDCTKIKTILTRTDDLCHPHSICYCDATRRLYVGRNNNTIKVYQLNA